jgi:hypothetical protein
MPAQVRDRWAGRKPVVDVGRTAPLLRTRRNDSPARRAPRAALQSARRRTAATHGSGSTTSGAGRSASLKAARSRGGEPQRPSSASAYAPICCARRQ